MSATVDYFIFVPLVCTNTLAISIMENATKTARTKTARTKTAR
jgi:hypothetical protein